MNYPYTSISCHPLKKWWYPLCRHLSLWNWKKVINPSRYIFSSFNPSTLKPSNTLSWYHATTSSTPSHLPCEQDLPHKWLRVSLPGVGHCLIHHWMDAQTSNRIPLVRLCEMGDSTRWFLIWFMSCGSYIEWVQKMLAPTKHSRVWRISHGICLFLSDVKYWGYLGAKLPW